MFHIYSRPHQHCPYPYSAHLHSLLCSAYSRERKLSSLVCARHNHLCFISIVGPVNIVHIHTPHTQHILLCSAYSRERKLPSLICGRCNHLCFISIVGPINLVHIHTPHTSILYCARHTLERESSRVWFVVTVIIFVPNPYTVASTLFISILRTSAYFVVLGIL